MCGLVGVLGKIDRALLSVYEDMLWVDQLRGNHSTGTAFISKDRINISKEVGPPGMLFGAKGYKKNFKRHADSARCVIGHNRFMTKGEITRENAHPFQHDHITLAHNGTLRDMRLMKEYDVFGTDSEAICKAIAVEGIENAYEKFNGAVTLTWWDDKEKSFNIISNGERPMFMGRTENDETMLWSSEDWIMEGIAKRRNVKLADPIWYPEKHKLHTFTIKDSGKIHLNINKLKEFTYSISTVTRWPNRQYGWEKEWYADNDVYVKRDEPQQAKNLLIENRTEQKTESLNDNAEIEMPAFLKRTLPQGSVDSSHKFNAVEFLKRYDTCVFCDQAFDIEPKSSLYFKDAVIIDKNVAACNGCAVSAMVNGTEIPE